MPSETHDESGFEDNSIDSDVLMDVMALRSAQNAGHLIEIFYEVWQRSHDVEKESLRNSLSTSMSLDECREVLLRKLWPKAVRAFPSFLSETGMSLDLVEKIWMDLRAITEPTLENLRRVMDQTGSSDDRRFEEGYSPQQLHKMLLSMMETCQELAEDSSSKSIK